MQAALEKDQADLERMKAGLRPQPGVVQREASRQAGFRTQEVHLRSAEGCHSRIRSPRRRRPRCSASSTPRSWPPRRRRIAQAKAVLVRFDDILHKHNSYSPIDGVVTNLPVRVGETVVPGIQNSAGSTIMTIADMSLITAEVKVDETDIVNVEVGPGGRYHHRRHSEQDVQGTCDRNRQHRHSALHRRGGFAERRFQPGSQGFQGGDRHGQSARTRSGRVFPARPRSPPPPARTR